MVDPKGSYTTKPNVKLAFAQFLKLSDVVVFIDYNDALEQMKFYPEDLYFVPSATSPMQIYSINVPFKTNYLADGYGSFFTINVGSF